MHKMIIVKNIMKKKEGHYCIKFILFKETSSCLSISEYFKELIIESVICERT